MSKLLGISQSTCSRICRECVLHVEPSRGGCPRSITPTHQQSCVRVIVVGGLDNVVDMRNPFNEHLNVVVSTNTVRRALHEVSLGSLEKQTSRRSQPRMCVPSWNLLNIINTGLSRIDIG